MPRFSLKLPLFAVLERWIILAEFGVRDDPNVKELPAVLPVLNFWLVFCAYVL